MKQLEIDVIEGFLKEDILNYKQFKPYYDEDGWLIVFPGEEDGRRPVDKVVKAVTFVQLKLKSKEDIVSCLKSLGYSNKRLAEVNPKLDFDRRRIKLLSNEIRFSIAWYDIAFFQQQKDKWKNNTHQSIFKSFNACLEDFIVEHIIL